MKTTRVTTTKRSLDYLRKRGLVAAVTETWLTYPERLNGVPTGKMLRIKRDLWNFADIIAFNPETSEVELVQTTTTSNQAARIAKILEIPEAKQWVTALNRKIHVHGWKQSKVSGKWEVTVTNLGVDEFRPVEELAAKDELW